MRLPDALSPLRDARFAWYYSGRFISTMGSVIAPVALVFADALGSFVAMPIGYLTFGPLAAVFGAQDVLVVAAILYVAIALVTLLSESVRNLSALDHVPEPVSS